MSEQQATPQADLQPSDNQDTGAQTDTNAPKAKGKKGADPAPAAVEEPKAAEEPPIEVDYSFKPPEGFESRILADDKILGILSESAKELNLDAATTESARNLISNVIKKMGESGILPENPYNYEAEMAALGENGETRAGDARTFVQALLDRNELTAQEAEEALSLTATAAGVSLLEKLRAQGAWKEELIPPKTVVSKQDRFKELVTDDRYGKDVKFTRDADLEIREKGLAAN